jgi:hypothetical protein
MFVLFCACDVMNVLSVKKTMKIYQKKKKNITMLYLIFQYVKYIKIILHHKNVKVIAIKS